MIVIFRSAHLFVAFDQPKSNHVQRVITGSLHTWLKFITLLDFDSIIAKFFYIARSNLLKMKC